MSDLVGNPGDRFSRVEAHIKVGFKGIYISHTCILTICIGPIIFTPMASKNPLSFEPVREKTNNLGF